jgi:hypothetical protein
MFHLDARAVSPFYGTLIKLRIGREGAAYLVDGNNQVLYSTNSAYIGREFPPHPATAPQNNSQVGAIRTHSFDGKDIVAGYAPVPRTYWSLVVERDWGDVIRTGQGYQQFLLLLLALGVIVPTVVVMFGVRRITGPIRLHRSRAAHREAISRSISAMRVMNWRAASQFNHGYAWICRTLSRVQQRTHETSA